MIALIGLGSNEWMMIWGGAIVLLALFIMWKTSGYDLTGAAFDSAWQVARGKRTAENPTALEDKLHNITSEATMTGKAKRAAGTLVGHVVAKVMSVLSMVMLILGAGLIAAGIWWR